jgi:hypothetical protein
LIGRDVGGMPFIIKDTGFGEDDVAVVVPVLLLPLIVVLVLISALAFDGPLEDTVIMSSNSVSDMILT